MVFVKSFQVTAGVILYNWSWPLPSTYSPIHHSQITLPSRNITSAVEKVPLKMNNQSINVILVQSNSYC
jgi:hypothetical protein